MKRIRSAAEREKNQQSNHTTTQASETTTAKRGGPVDALQRSAGNQAVTQLYERGDLQAKLDVSRPTDDTEREAERVATQIVETDHATVDEIQPKGDPKSRSVDQQSEARIEALQGGGRPLPADSRSFFESRFGRDFGTVRVHTGDQADRAARSIDAEAFTLGRDVAFAKGNYEPNTKRGRKLLAHELTHVVQQSEQGTASRLLQREGRSPSSTTEYYDAKDYPMDHRDVDPSKYEEEMRTQAVDAFEEFRSNRHTVEDFSPSGPQTISASFDLMYDPSLEQSLVQLGLAFNFDPAASAGGVTYTNAQKSSWKSQMISQVQNKWTRQHQLHCVTQDEQVENSTRVEGNYDDFVSDVVVSVYEASGDAHYELTIVPIPRGSFHRSYVQPPGSGSETGGGELDTEDVRGAGQRASVHEAGHMFGLPDEYEQQHSTLFGLWTWTTGQDDQRIMSTGEQVNPSHYRSFVLAQEAATGLDWDVQAGMSMPSR